MIPGVTNRLRLHATTAGIYRGQCAEYCGGPHALMSFHVVALEADAFEAWLAAQRRPRRRRRRADRPCLLAAGCHGCHTVRGTGAAGTIGPDLTHVASRLSLGAATLPADAGQSSDAGCARTSTSSPAIACRRSAFCRPAMSTVLADVPG